MAWGSFTALTLSTTVFTTEIFSTIVSANVGESIYFAVQNLVLSTGANQLTIKCYSGRDNTTTAMDTQPIYQKNLANGALTNTTGFVISGFPYMRLGFITDGSTDTHTVFSWFTKDGVSL